LPLESLSINWSFADEDWQLIELFRQRVVEFNDIWKGLEPKQLQAHMVLGKGSKHSGSAIFPSDKELKAYYMAFRLFYLNDEACSLLKIRNIIAKISTAPKFLSLMRKIKSQWNEGLGKHQMSDFYKREIRGKDLLDLWFNAHYFHSDLEKMPKLDEINGFLSEDISRYLLYRTVLQASLAVDTLYKSTRFLEQSGGYIEIPLWLIGEAE